MLTYILHVAGIPIVKPSKVNHPSATFSAYKKRNTLKTMIGIKCVGVVSSLSDSYGDLLQIDKL